MEIFAAPELLITLKYLINQHFAGQGIKALPHLKPEFTPGKRLIDPSGKVGSFGFRVGVPTWQWGVNSGTGVGQFGSGGGVPHLWGWVNLPFGVGQFGFKVGVPTLYGG